MKDLWKPAFTHKDVEVFAEHPLHLGFCPVKRYSYKFRLFEGGWSKITQRELVFRPKSVGVLLYDPEQDVVVLIEQLRIGAFQEPEGPWLLEVVAGMVDEGETPEACAIRETKEESGYDIQSLQPICTYWTSPGMTNEKITLYCGFVKAKPSGDVFGLAQDGENIRVHTLKALDAFALLKEGKIGSSPAVIALQWLEGQRGQDKGLYRE